ncbi:hypothetical protein PN462_00995 [Spirulina sp. CS-785/01]|uniref:hypothetical protein n=1 Tax=Spirulina sp. CS-785/01 TaxID=3021716 RepID=UPI00232BF465|nr:hypothetical protein [Spirulina sp. CS-785/01]MDB9311659.1 hypothetical protein [Spirulina sp. CS-785/01]
MPLLTMVSSSCTYQSCVSLAVDVFLSQDPALLRSLKDFLLVLPNPQAIETVLTQALYQVAATHPQVCCWLLRHPNYLLPELDLLSLAVLLVGKTLEREGFVLSDNFYTEANSTRFLGELATTGLLQQAAKHDRLLHLFLNEYTEQPGVS